MISPYQKLVPLGFATACFALLSFCNQSVSGEDTSEFQQAIESTGPVAHWSFSAPIEESKDKRIVAGPSAPIHKQFGKNNKALFVDNTARLEIPDEGDESRFDFDNGDEISVEAMVNPKRLADQAVIAAKGRTFNPGFAQTNQNWAFRLKSVDGNAGVNFLFRSRNQKGKSGDWHRWTTVKGFPVDSGWHHVAISYRFGDPKSICAFIDGKKVDGKWDMGGPTPSPPVVDNDELWIGSAMGGNRGNSFYGKIDEVALYRKVVSKETFASRFKWVAPPEPPLIIPDPEQGVVRLDMHGPLEKNTVFPNDPGEPLTSWTQSAMGFVRIPRKHNEYGIRDDWGTGVMVRAVSEIELEPGEYEFLARSRSLARLFVDKKQVLYMSKPKRGGGAHNQVQPIPEGIREGIRRPALDDEEKIIKFKSPGGNHSIVFDVMVGGPKLRLEFGEACLAIARNNEMFQLVGAGSAMGADLTDTGWLGFAKETMQQLDVADTNNRRAADHQTDYWQKRHTIAANELLSQSNRSDTESKQSIDSLIASRIANAKRSNGASSSFYHDRVQPILAKNCYRCHGDKQKGDLDLRDQQNLFAGGESGSPAIVPGKPDESYLIALVGPDSENRMPPKGDGLTEDELQILKRWVTEGGKVEQESQQIADVTPVVDDLTFLRRAWIDTVGVAPPLEVIASFQADKSADKRRRMIDTLLQDDRWADNWVGYWQDVLAENPNLLKPMLNNTGPFRYWILESLRDNKPMDRFATELIMLRGSTWGGGAAGFGVATQNDVPMAAKAHIIGTAFLGVDMKCARCHDAPYHETTQQDLFQLAAMLGRKSIKVPGTSSVPKTFFEHIKSGGREPLIDVTLKIGSKVTPQWPFDSMKATIPDGVLRDAKDTREQVAAQVTFSRRFAEVMVNRVWKRLIGAGIIEPVDDWEGHVPSDPQLLEFLADEFVRSGYDLKELSRLIMNSSLYQRQTLDPPENLVSAPRFFEGPYRRRMTAEQVVDNAWHVAGKEMDLGELTMDIEGRLAPNYFMNFGSPQRAWEFTTLANERDRPSLAMPRMQAVVDLLLAFGWRNSRQDPTSHRIEDPNPLQPGVLANGVMGTWMTQLTDDSEVTQMCIDAKSPDALVEQLFLRFLTRSPTEQESLLFTSLLDTGFNQRVVPSEKLMPPSKPERFPHVSWSNHLDNEANSIKQQQEELARRGNPPTRFLFTQWRERAEDALWALLNAPEMIMIP